MDLAAALKEKIENLNARIDALQADAKPLRDQLANIDRQRGKLETERAELRDRLVILKKAPRVSDHAVIRFLERKYGFTFEDIRKQLLTPCVIAAMNAGADAVKIDGGKLKIQGRTIVTFID